MTLFWILAVILIASAVFTVTQRSPVYSVVGLLTNFLALAALYLTLNAEFLAIIQVVVYSGAILMLFVFVIALLSSGVGPFREGPDRLPRVLLPALARVSGGARIPRLRGRTRAARAASGPPADLDARGGSFSNVTSRSHTGQANASIGLPL